MRELVEFLGAEISVPTLWIVASALLLVAAGARSAWPAIMAMLLIFLYYLLQLVLGT